MILRIILAATASLTLAGCGAIPSSRAPQKPHTAAPAPAAINPASQLCLAHLTQQRAQYAPLPDRYYGAGCSSVGAVNLAAASGDHGSLQFSNLGAVACPLANGVVGWARYGVDRAAREVFGKGLVRIETMGSYSCRKVAGSERLSAHARAEAVDVSGFLLTDGTRISVLGGWGASDKERRFLRLVHASACKRFGTVLGPDYNAAHRDHLHLEMGGGGFCR